MTANGQLVEELFTVTPLNQIIHYVGERALKVVRDEDGRIVYGEEQEEQNG